MIHGFINLNKSAGWTSHDCVARVRRLLNTKKVGHGGTLDPLATGVLPIAVGRATKLLQYLPDGKAYQAKIRFGVVTSTDDLEGDIIQLRSADHLERQAVEAVLPQFIGKLAQVPPMYSAVQVAGKRLYDLARQGKAVEVPIRQVVIHSLMLQGWQVGEQPELNLDVACGTGTYIRSLARDLGEAMGTGATLAGLVRSHSSGFELSDSITLDELAESVKKGTFAPVPAGKAMVHLEAITLPPQLACRWQLGQKLTVHDVSPYMTPTLEQAPLLSPVRVITSDTKTFLGIGEFREGQPTVSTVASSSSNLEPSSPAMVQSAKLDSPDPHDSETMKIFAPKRVFLPLG